MRNVVIIFFVFFFCCSKNESQEPLYVINLIQDTCDMHIPLRTQEGKLFVIKIKLQIEDSQESPVSDEWLLNHTKLTLQDVAKEPYISFNIKDFKKRANYTLQRNLHSTLDKQAIQHDKIFPCLKIIKAEIVPFDSFKYESIKQDIYDSKRIYE